MNATPQSNKYIGLIKSGRAVMLVYEGGTLVLDKNQPGWGVMTAGTLQSLLPQGCSPRRPSPSSSSTSRSASGSSSADEAMPHGDIDPDFEGELEDDLDDDTDPQHLLHADQAAYFDGLSDLEDTSSSGSTSSSDSESMPNARLHAPPIDSVGWTPCDAALRVAPVSSAALQAHVSATTPAARRALADRFNKGQLAPHPPADPAAGIMVSMQVFGEPHLMAWTGHWAPAGDAVHLGMGLTSTVAQALVEHARVANHCNLAPVLQAEPPRLKALVEDVVARVMVFRHGLLVERHTDPALVGWHVLGDKGRWSLVKPGTSEALIKVNMKHRDGDSPAMRLFMDGVLHEGAQDGPPYDFLAMLWSEQRSAWVALRVVLPRGCICAGDPMWPSDLQVRQALQLARWAPMHDEQRITGPFSVGSHRWQVPVPLGVLRCLTAGESAPELLHATCHDTLMPVLEKLLTAHKAQEKDWLAKGVIRQPIDGLLALMRRDTRLRRPEVCVQWPVSLLEEIFRTLAPKVKVQVTQNPTLDGAQKALTGHASRLFVFQGVQQPFQSAALAFGVQHWTDNRWGPVDALTDRVQRAFKPDAQEHLVAMAVLC